MKITDTTKIYELEAAGSFEQVLNQFLTMYPEVKDLADFLQDMAINGEDCVEGNDGCVEYSVNVSHINSNAWAIGIMINEIA